MPPLRQPSSLFQFAKDVLTSEVAFRVRVMMHCCLNLNLNYLEKVISFLPIAVATDIARAALHCTDYFCERSPVSPLMLHPLVRTLIHDSTTEFPVTEFHSYQLRQAVLKRLCDLRHLRTYYNLEYFHENVNILSVLRRFQSLSNLRNIYLPHWCTDEIAHLLGASCPNLRLLDATNSLSMTDKSVPSLSKCVRLKVLLISSTNISNKGCKELLENLPFLQKIGPCHCLASIIAVIRKNRENSYPPLSLKEYDSDEIPDENTTSMCPNLVSVHLGAYNHSVPFQLSNGSKLPHQVTDLKIQSMSHYGNPLNAILTSNITNLDLDGYVVSEQEITTIANICRNLRVFKLNPQLTGYLRLSTNKPDPFPFLEVLDITDSALGIDLLMVSPRIRLVNVRPREFFQEFLPITPVWTDHTLNMVLNKNRMEFLESFCLSTRCNFTYKNILKFLQSCPRLRYLGNVHTWSPGWDEKICKLHRIIRQKNLAVELQPNSPFLSNTVLSMLKEFE